MDYTLIKHIHMAAAALSVTLFGLRAWWSATGSTALRRPWVRIVPHLIDTLLLAAGVTLMVMLQAWPTRQPWLAAKLVGLVVYIGLGSVAIRRGRAAAALAALVVFAYIVGAAVAHDPRSWLALS
ncbi:SirB2 family protein [Modicisalibacter coralii]|uniref:SirB2 family protein n=1 Tax=Modicisalibacter coralii TaxID=2304602 RepID=UPI00100A9889|nr:SirB2 family protein [Halomonas coralii]